MRRVPLVEDAQNPVTVQIYGHPIREARVVGTLQAGATYQWDSESIKYPVIGGNVITPSRQPKRGNKLTINLAAGNHTAACDIVEVEGEHLQTANNS